MRAGHADDVHRRSLDFVLPKRPARAHRESRVGAQRGCLANMNRCAFI